MKKNPWVVPFVAGSRGDRYAHLERRALSQYIHGDSVTARAEFLKARMQEVFLCGVQVSSVLDHLLAIGVTLPLFRVALNPRFTRPFYAVPRTSAARTASG